nr:MAG TPA: hypothetical protein [Caudoviricetes sp.]
MVISNPVWRTYSISYKIVGDSWGDYILFK